ncbi:hypothetical protein RHMOL_Rhmol11G0056600 [Rhododendron molle]|uniref:Uncharacterized protein n=1 Tax=Rhododendron molle TaxID=49168 RepID=A0ACC0LPF4_RHOML|nr:hypothetical protein RHMOL_Rhmol11G0056600 [Rhododendron molle]
MDLDDEGRLRNVFWADARSRAACKEFGDVVTFDTTYLVNKYDMPFAPFVSVNHHGQSILLGCGLISHEDTKSFSWLFKTWMTCMWGSAPKAIITDQCMAMKNAIEEVFPNTRHRWCIWHIMKKVPEKLGKYDAYKSISPSFHNVVYDSLTKDEFEDAWEVFIKKYKLEDNEWLHGLYLERNRWVPAFVKDVFWAGMSSTQRSESMNHYFDDYINSKTTLKQFVEQYENALAKKVDNEKNEDTKSSQSYIPCIVENELEKQFQSAYTNAKVKEFQNEFVGKLNCSLHETKASDVWSEHQLMVFHERGVQRVPHKYVFRRWRKDVKRVHTKVRIKYDNSSSTIEARQHDNMCNLFDEVADLAEDSQEKRLRHKRGWDTITLQFQEVGTQESVINVNSYPSYIGQLMWPNMMSRNMRPNMAQGGSVLPAQGESVLPFSPSLCPTRTGFNQFINNFSSSQSNMPSFTGTQVWGRGQSTFLGDQGQDWGGAQPNFTESQGQGGGGAHQSFTEMIFARHYGEE